MVCSCISKFKNIINNSGWTLSEFYSRFRILEQSITKLYFHVKNSFWMGFSGSRFWSGINFRNIWNHYQIRNKFPEQSITELYFHEKNSPPNHKTTYNKSSLTHRVDKLVDDNSKCNDDSNKRNGFLEVTAQCIWGAVLDLRWRRRSIWKFRVLKVIMISAIKYERHF